MRVWVSVLMAIALAVAGCAEDAGDDEDLQTTAGEAGNETAPGDDGSGGDKTAPDSGETGSSVNETGSNLAPVANLTADLLNGTAPLNVTFHLDGTDADGDNLTWSLSVATLAGNTSGAPDPLANGTVLPASVNHTFGAGNFSVLFEVSDGVNTTQQNLTVTVLEGGPSLPTTAVIEDGGLDGGGAFTEITQVDLEVTADTVEMVMHLNAVDAGAGDSPFLYQLHINGVVLENYVLVGNGLWDNTNDQGADGSAGRDPASGTATISVSRGYLEGVGVVAPYAISAGSYLGEGLAGGQEEVDRAPDDGEVLLGAP